MRAGSCIVFAMLGLAAARVNAETSNSGPHCARDEAALRGLLQAEYAFNEEARASVRSAFLDYLAEDSLVLSPGPHPGRALYSATNEDGGQLQWYPADADIAASEDLGFTTGPWVYLVAQGGAQSNGHFLTIWKRGVNCRWQVALDGGVAHDAPSSAEPKLMPDQLFYAKPAPPPQRFIAGDAASHALIDFQAAVREAGFPAALRTYGRNGDFRFYTDGRPPMGVAAACVYLTAHAIVGGWKEDARDRSADSTLQYSVGELTDRADRSTHSYVQIWQYDPKVANWGLRILLIKPLPPQ